MKQENNKELIFKKYQCELDDEIIKCYDYSVEYWGDKDFNKKSFFEIIKSMKESTYPLPLFERFKKFRNINSQARTLEKYQLRYGIEEGTKKFNEYRNKQAISNSYEYKKEKYGWTKEQFNKYNQSRAVTLDNLILKYGIEEGTKKFNEYCEKQKYVGCDINYFINKYGEEDGRIKYKEILDKKIKGLMKILNVGVSKLEKQILNSLYSEEYEFYVNCVVDEIKNRDVYINDLNYQFYLYSEKYNKKFYYDGCILDKKILIEIHGDFWHYNKRNKHIINAFAKDKEIIISIKNRLWRDKAKIEIANDSGFVVYTIWELDWKLHSKEIIEHFKKWVKMNPTNNYSTENTYGNKTE